ncbi:hypothetical protein PHMEG_00027870, partial [Phytophthora megakarya]
MPPLRYIASNKKLKALLSNYDNKPVATTGKVVGVHFQFAGSSPTDQVVAIALGNDSPTSEAVVLQIGALDRNEVISGLKTLMEDDQIVKVVFDLGRTAKWLRGYGMTGVTLANCMDLQLVYKQQAKVKASNATLETIVSKLGGSSTVALQQQIATFNAKLKDKAWTKSPLAPPMWDILAKTMWLYTRCYNAVCGIPETKHAFPEVTVPCTKYITTNSELQRLVQQNNNKLVEDTCCVVGVHFQFAQDKAFYPGQEDDEQLVAISIVGSDPSDTAIVLQFDTLDQELLLFALKTLLQDPTP